MNPSIIALSIFSLLLLIREAKSQGCSDAGICTLPSMVPVTENYIDSAASPKNSVNAGVVFGTSQHNVLVFTPYVEYGRTLGKSLNLSGRFTYGFRSGELADLHGPSDLFLSAGYTFLEYFTATAGVKIPMNNANRMAGNNPLPMNYQTTLGSVDLLLGFGYTWKRLSVTAGYQQPLVQNGNQFLASDYPETAPEYKYFSTRNYHRAPDVMLRVSYIAVQSKKINLITSVLPIFHMDNDTYEEPDGRRVELYDSQGLTLNLNVVLQYHFSRSQSLELNLGAPALARSVRPDGLSKFAVGLGYNIRF